MYRELECSLSFRAQDFCQKWISIVAGRDYLHCSAKRRSDKCECSRVKTFTFSFRVAANSSTVSFSHKNEIRDGGGVCVAAWGILQTAKITAADTIERANQPSFCDSISRAHSFFRRGLWFCYHEKALNSPLLSHIQLNMDGHHLVSTSRPFGSVLHSWKTYRRYCCSGALYKYSCFSRPFFSPRCDFPTWRDGNVGRRLHAKNLWAINIFQAL